jgi:hypothetical protein
LNKLVLLFDQQLSHIKELLYYFENHLTIVFEENSRNAQNNITRVISSSCNLLKLFSKVWIHTPVLHSSSLPRLYGLLGTQTQKVRLGCVFRKHFFTFCINKLNYTKEPVFLKSSGTSWSTRDCYCQLCFSVSLSLSKSGLWLHLRMSYHAGSSLLYS